MRHVLPCFFASDVDVAGNVDHSKRVASVAPGAASPGLVLAVISCDCVGAGVGVSQSKIEVFADVF